MSLIKALDTIFQAQATIVSNANGPGPDVVWMWFTSDNAFCLAFGRQLKIVNLWIYSLLFQTSCYSKLEKADILEMTVRYLRSVRNQNMTGKQNGESLIVEYQRVIELLL